MAKNGNAAPQTNANRPSHMPENSVFYEKIIPAALVFLGIVMVGLIVFSVAIIFGWIAF